jgi:hypothetical protein
MEAGDTDYTLTSREREIPLDEHASRLMGGGRRLRLTHRMGDCTVAVLSLCGDVMDQTPSN